MKHYAKKLKQSLMSEIRELADRKREFCRNPVRDFTRERKLTFEEVIKILVSMGGDPLRTELFRHGQYSPETASVSAFVQQRSKILPEAMEHLFRRFTMHNLPTKLYQGFRILAVDGTDLQFTADPQDKASYFPGKSGQLHYSMMHLNALFDLSSRTYLDAVVQKRRNMHESAALVQMVDRCTVDTPVLLLADRNYEAYNVITHLSEKGWKYLIRIRKSNGFVAGFPCSNLSEFDISETISLTRKKNKLTKQLIAKDPIHFRFLPQHVVLDFLPPKSDDFYTISFRIVRFSLPDDVEETVITNLEADLYPPEKLKQLYFLRWGIETSFRQLKYTVGLRQFQCKKVEHVTQEIFARLLMYNFTEMITFHVIIQNKSRKYAYQANFSAAVHICRQFLRGSVSPPHVEAMIAKHILPLRPGRSTIRNLNHIRFTGFYYRIA